MRGNPFLDFHQTAESHGYPALLIISMLCLGLVVAAVTLLALTEAAWALTTALLSVIVAVAILAGAMDAAFSDRGEPAPRGAGLPAAAPEDRATVVPLTRPQAATRQPGPDRKAA